jgi:hypothetical protein
MKTKMAKILLALALVFGGALFANTTIVSESASAACGDGVFPTTSFFGLRPWWSGVAVDNSGAQLCSPVAADAANAGSIGTNEIALSVFIWRIVFNVMEILLRVIAYAAVVFVLIGGFHMLTSSGDPGKIAKGKQTISYALIGVVIALLSGGMVAFVNQALLNTGTTTITVSPDGSASSSNPGAGADATWIEATSGFLMIAGICAVMMVVWGGVKLSMSAGDPTATAKAKNTIIFALIGAVVMIAASFIVRLVTNAVTGTP